MFNSLTMRRVLFVIKPRQRCKYPNVDVRFNFFRGSKRSLGEGKLLLMTPGIRNILIFAKSLIYESLLLSPKSLTRLETRRFFPETIFSQNYFRFFFFFSRFVFSNSLRVMVYVNFNFFFPYLNIYRLNFTSQQTPIWGSKYPLLLRKTYFLS